jgi:hypothetical protein
MRSSRTANVFLLVAIVATATVPAAIAGPRYGGRGVSLEYTGPAPAVSTPRLSYLHDQCTYEDPAPGCVVTRIRPRDRFVAIGVRDEVGGRLVGASVWVESGDGHFDILGEVCGDSQEVPFEIPAGYDFVEVHVEAGACSGSITPSVVTMGTVDMWFSTRRFR